MTLLAVAGAWIAGVYLADRTGPGGAALGLFVLSALLVALWLKLGRRSVKPAVLATVLLLGILRADGVGDPPSSLNPYHGAGVVRVRGLVNGDAESVGAAYRFRLRVEDLSRGNEWVEASGNLLVTANPSPELAGSRDRPYFRYGDFLQLEGVLEAPPELDDFDYPGYLADQGIGTVMPFPVASLVEQDRGSPFIRALNRMRRSLADSLAESVPEPEASLGQALLLGLRDSLPEDLVDQFRDTGTAHLLAISGLHVGVLLALSLGLSGWVLGRRHQLYLPPPFLLVWLYGLLAGMSPSVTRAAIMGTVYLAALFFGRPRSVLPALGFAAALVVAVSPGVLWSVSFQLSFAAMIGIAILADPIAGRLRWLYDGHAGQPQRPSDGLVLFFDCISYSAAMVIAASVTTMPLAMLYFEHVSLVGLPTTLLVLPALPFVLVTNTFASVTGLASTAVSEPIGWVAWLASSYVTLVVGAVSKLPGASVDTGRVAPFLVLAYYAMLIGVVASSTLRPKIDSLAVRLRGPSTSSPSRGRPVRWWALLSAVIVAALVWLAALTAPDGRLHVSFVDVGQGDAVLIETPGGRRVIVDGGPEQLEMVRYLGDRMPFRDRTVDLVVLTHGHTDHVNGLLELLRRYDVETVLERATDHDGAPYLAWHRAVGLEQATVVTARPGIVVSLDNGAFIEVLGPPDRLPKGTQSDVDNASVVLRLVYGDFSFLLTGDAFAHAEDGLIRRQASTDSDVLKVGHHGSRSSSSRAFLDAVSPAIAVISAGKDGRNGYPHDETLAALSAYVPPEQIFLTGDHGTIEFITDGESLSVKTER